MANVGFDIVKLKRVKKYKIVKSTQVAIFCAQWHKDITLRMLEECDNALQSLGVRKKLIHKFFVQGSLELPLGAQFLLSNKDNEYNAIICLGCVIKGDTPHFDFIGQSVSNSILNLSLNYNLPVISGVLTTLNKDQAIARIDGSVANKGAEVAIAAVSMIALKKDIDESFNKLRKDKESK